MTEAFAFDFYEAEANMQAAEVALPLTAHTSGTCNAIAFWFTLHLDEDTELNTSPYETKVSLGPAVRESQKLKEWPRFGSGEIDILMTVYPMM